MFLFILYLVMKLVYEKCIVETKYFFNIAIYSQKLFKNIIFPCGNHILL